MQIIPKSSIITGRITYSAFYKIIFLIKIDKEQLEPKCSPGIKLRIIKNCQVFFSRAIYKEMYTCFYNPY